ncbi:MAG: HAMP domain-containing histidine kinase [Labilithrix sp.]|nr:HAMP domain-containing histidine kinase [Labilithrix sp.]
MQVTAAFEHAADTSRRGAAPAPGRPERARPASSPSPATITVAWLVRLRWGAVLGQTVTIAIAVLGLKLDLPIVPLALLVMTTVISNAALALRLRRAHDVATRTVGLVLAADVFVLSGLLYCSGGPSNPFSVVYLVHVTLAALVLGVRWAGAMVALSAVLYAALFFWHVPVAALNHAHHHGASPFSVHLQGMWVAFSVSASLIAYFVARVAGALRARESELAETKELAARSEKLASLTTLAAGAAHELGTPLGTIAVASKELERSIRVDTDEALDDARLIRTEVARCRAIVQRMSAQAGDTMGELPGPTTAAEAFRSCLERLGTEAEENVVVDVPEAAPFACPPEGLVQVLLSLVQNARWAVREAGKGRISLRSSCTPKTVRLIVQDDGVGITEGALARIGEPFFTTKPPGEGMGLGLFLARTFAERWGGSFEITSREGTGTTVTLELPRVEDGRT